MLRDDLAKLQQSGSFFSDAFNFQESHPAALLELSYYVVADDYFEKINQLSQSICPGIIADYPGHSIDSFYYKNVPLDVAAFNLTRHFCIKELDVPFLRQKLGGVLQEFRSMTNCLLSFREHPYHRARKEYEKDDDLLLVCYAGKIRHDDWEESYDRNENKVKSTFFAFLWHKNFITEQELFDNGVMLGRHLYEIPQEKKRLESLGI